MECLANKIGLRICGRDGEIFIDDLPEVSLKRASEITSQDKKGSDFLFRIIDHAADVVSHEFATGMDLFLFGTVLQNDVYGFFNTTAITPVGTSTFTPYLCEKYTVLRVNSISVKPVGATIGTITITHDCGADVFTYNADCLTKIAINTTYTGVINITHTADATVYSSTTCNCGYDQSCDSCCGCVRKSGDNTLGLQIDISCICDKEKFICAYATELRYLVAYRTAILFMVESLNSDRMTPFILWGKTVAASNIERLEKKEVEEKDRVLLSIRTALLKEGSECIECTGLSYKISEP